MGRKRRAALARRAKRTARTVPFWQSTPILAIRAAAAMLDER